MSSKKRKHPLLEKEKLKKEGSDGSDRKPNYSKYLNFNQLVYLYFVYLHF
jgi:hypothetical protein